MKISQMLKKQFLLLLSVSISSATQSLSGQENYDICFIWISTIGAKGSAPGQFKNPQAISIDPEGNLYICDTGNNRIQKLNQRGEFIKDVGGFGWNKEQFDQPLDVHACSALDIFVADYQNQRIERYDRDLNYISSLKPLETWPEKLRFGLPIGVGFSNRRELFIVDDENQRILKINSFGEPELSFGDFDAGEGRLECPIQIEVDRCNHIYVSDESADKIFVYDYFGNYLSEIGSTILNAPRGLFKAENGFLFVADTGNHRVVIFNTSGAVAAFCSNHKSIPIRLIEPVDVVFFKNKMYVLDRGNSVIQIFEVMGILCGN